MHVGFIGLGIMGSRMAANLLADGHDLVVHNRTKAKAETLTADGARWADTPAAAARDADVLITMLAHPDAVRATATGPDGFLDALRPQTIWMDCSTVNPSFSHAMAAAAQERDVRFIDAPVAGTKGPAAEGALLFLAGGDSDDLDDVRVLINAMGRSVYHMGGVGKGTSAKMLVNLLLAQAMVAFSEALVLGQALGFSRDQLFEMLIGGPVVPPFVQGKRPKLENNSYEADFPLKWMQKDLHLAAQTAYEQGVAVPLSSVAEEIYALAARHGFSESDFSAIYAFLAQK